MDFDSNEQANKSLSHNDQSVEGKTLFIALSKPPKYTHNAPTLFLNNLPFICNKDDISEAMTDFS